MSKDDQDELFAQWLDGRLSEDAAEGFAKLRREDSAFSERVALAQQLQHSASAYDERPVPHWHRCAQLDMAVYSDVVPWWRWQWLPLTAFVMSCCAMLMILLRVETTVHEGGFTLSFSRHAGADIERVIEQRLDKIQQEQNAFLLGEIHRFREHQVQSNNQLVNYLVTQGRSERKEDFNQLVKYIHELRRDDQIFYAQQVVELKEVLQHSDKAAGPFTRTNYPVNQYPYETQQ